MAFDGDGDGTARRQRATKTTARIELKRRMADGGCQTAVSAVVDIATLWANIFIPQVVQSLIKILDTLLIILGYIPTHTAPLGASVEGVGQRRIQRVSY